MTPPRLPIAAALLLALTCTTAHASDPTPTPTPPRTPHAILADIDAAADALPKADPARLNDAAYGDRFAQQSKPYFRRLTDLERELYERHPTHPDAGRYMFARANTLLRNVGEDPAVVVRDYENYLRDHPGSPLKNDARYCIAFVRARQAKGDPKALLEIAESFAHEAPEDPRAPELLFDAARAMPNDAPARLDLLRRIARGYPDSWGGQRAAGQVRQADQIGKPFDLAFTDFTTGPKVSVADFRGKAALIDFWATWCSPCVADLPNLQALHDKYADKGLAVIGVNLDFNEQGGGGPKPLADFLKKHPHPWPQYYQGNGFDSEFSSRWGITAIPTLFLLDQAGNLHTTHTRRAADVEPIINDLLNAKK